MCSQISDNFLASIPATLIQEEGVATHVGLLHWHDAARCGHLTGSTGPRTLSITGAPVQFRKGNVHIAVYIGILINMQHHKGSVQHLDSSGQVPCQLGQPCRALHREHDIPKLSTSRTFWMMCDGSAAPCFLCIPTWLLSTYRLDCVFIFIDRHAEHQVAVSCCLGCANAYWNQPLGMHIAVEVFVCGPESSRNLQPASEVDRCLYVYVEIHGCSVMQSALKSSNWQAPSIQADSLNSVQKRRARH